MEHEMAKTQELEIDIIHQKTASQILYSRFSSFGSTISRSSSNFFPFSPLFALRHGGLMTFVGPCPMKRGNGFIRTIILLFSLQDSSYPVIGNLILSYLQGPAVTSSTGVSWANGTSLDQGHHLSFEEFLISDNAFKEFLSILLQVIHLVNHGPSAFSMNLFLQFFKCHNLDVKDHKARSMELAGRNVRHINTIQSWEEKLTEATRDGKIEFSNSWDINATPTFFFLKDGRKVDKFVGADTVELPKKIAAVANLASRNERLLTEKAVRNVKGGRRFYQ
ncbi:hypothetical protein CRYUN_Cryun05aG0130400 [Craigia yunnanensis]